MASYMLFDSLSRLTKNKQLLTPSDKLWLIDAINNKLNIEGKEKLYSLLIVFNKHQTSVYDPKDPFYEIDKLESKLQVIWFEFTKMHLKSQESEKKRKL